MVRLGGLDRIGLGAILLRVELWDVLFLLVVVGGSWWKESLKMSRWVRGEIRGGDLWLWRLGIGVVDLVGGLVGLVVLMGVLVGEERTWTLELDGGLDYLAANSVLDRCNSRLRRSGCLSLGRCLLLLLLLLLLLFPRLMGMNGDDGVALGRDDMCCFGRISVGYEI